MFLRAKYHRFAICVNLNKLEKLLTMEWLSRRRAQFLLHHLTSKIQLIMEQENVKFICNEIITRMITNKCSYIANILGGGGLFHEPSLPRAVCVSLGL